MKKTFQVAKVISPRSHSSDVWVGCAIPLPREKTLLADVIASAELLKQKGAEDTALTCLGGDNYRLAVMGGRGPRLFGRHWSALSSWPARLIKYLESTGILYFRKIGTSDIDTIRELKMREEA